MNVAITEITDKHLVSTLTAAIDEARVSHTAHLRCESMTVDVVCLGEKFQVRIAGADWQIAGIVERAEAVDLLTETNHEYR